MAESVQADLASRRRKGPTKLHSLTGLRFLAAFLVFLFHTGLSMNPIDPSSALSPFADDTVAYWYERLFSTGGFVGVSFFFVLSGFVLAWSRRPGDSSGLFIRRRLVKIFPNHVVMWALAMLLFAGGVATWEAWLPNLFLLHPLFPDMAISQSVNMPSWSLGCELLFYVSFPFLIRPISRLRGHRLWAAAAAVVAGLALYQVLITTALPGPAPGSGVAMSDTQYWLSYLFPLGRMFEFVLGAILAHIVLSGRWPRVSPRLAITIMVLGYAATLFVPVQYTINLVTLVPIGILVASFADADARGERTGMRGRLFVWFGKISFGFYMCQSVTIFYLRSVMGGEQYSTPVGLVVLAGLFAVTLLGGWLLYRFVEMPMMRRWGGPRRSPSRFPGADPTSLELGEGSDVVRSGEKELRA